LVRVRLSLRVPYDSTRIDINVLNSGTPCFVTVDAINGSGITPEPKPTSVPAPPLAESKTTGTISAKDSVHPLGFEPKTPSFGGKYSIQLSYGCVLARRHGAAAETRQ
jgi:hypothetical protein